MSVRSVFISKSVYPFFEEVYVTFDWFGGFALSQKRKCQIGLHQNFLKAYPDRKVLISYHYLFDGMAFYAPPFHISLFYDYLYLNALLEPKNAQVRDQLMEGGYTAFTDLATKSLNSQARSAAILWVWFKLERLIWLRITIPICSCFAQGMTAAQLVLNPMRMYSF